MSDSSSKPEGYKSFLIEAAVPSTPLCFFIIFVILKSYSTVSGIYCFIFTWIFSGLSFTFLVLTVLKYKRLFNTRRMIIVTSAVIIALCSGLSFYLHSRISDLISDKNLPPSAENISVIVDDICQKRYSSEIYFHSADNASPELRGIIFYQGENIYNSGDNIFLHKKIHRVSAGTDSGFNNYLISQGIYYTAGMSESDITILKKSTISFRKSIQKSLLLKIDSLFNRQTAGVVKALLTGNQNYIDKKIILKFRDSGVLHVLSASGLHVAIFAAIPAFLLFPFFRRNIVMSASLSAVIFYLFITDMPVSLIRAVIMFAFLYFQVLLFRKRNVFNYLMLTCIVILCVSPWEIFAPGFQLSFAATAGILLFYRQYKKSLKSLPGIISGSAAVTLSAQIITLPVIMFHMHQMNTAGIAANIIIIPLTTIIMGTAMGAVLFSYILIPAAAFFADITELFLNLTVIITDFFSNLKLNFYVYDINAVLIFFITLSLIPLINNSKIQKLKFYPVLISVILCTVYLKQSYQQNGGSCIISNGKSAAEIRLEERRQVLRLNLEENADQDEILTGLKMKNTDIKIIELASNSFTNLSISKKILNDYAIEEYRFAGIPDLSNMFKKLIFQLENDNVIVKFEDNRFL